MRSKVVFLDAGSPAALIEEMGDVDNFMVAYIKDGEVYIKGRSQSCTLLIGLLTRAIIDLHMDSVS